jgi:hypothetical protein
MTNYFSKDEARSKIGKDIKTLTRFADIPIGTTGKVVEAYKMDFGAFGLMIQWNISDTIKDGFSKDEYEEFLDEV